MTEASRCQDRARPDARRSSVLYQTHRPKADSGGFDEGGGAIDKATPAIHGGRSERRVKSFSRHDSAPAELHPQQSVAET
jgi:hypothetical protein